MHTKTKTNTNRQTDSQTNTHTDRQTNTHTQTGWLAGRCVIAERICNISTDPNSTTRPTHIHPSQTTPTRRVSEGMQPAAAHAHLSNLIHPHSTAPRLVHVLGTVDSRGQREGWQQHTPTDTSIRVKKKGCISIHPSNEANRNGERKTPSTESGGVTPSREGRAGLVCAWNDTRRGVVA